MKQVSLGLVTLVGSLTLGTAFGCSDDGGGGGAPTGATPSVPPPAPGQCITEMAADGSLLLRAVDANNYSLANEITIKQTAIGPGPDLTIDWSALTMDFFKHPIGAGDITNVTIALFKDQYEGLVTALETDTLPKPIVGLSFPVDGTRTSVTIKEMNVAYTGQKPPEDELNTYFNPAEAIPTEYAYTVTVNEGDILKSNVKMIHYLYLDPNAAPNSTISLTNDSATIMATAVIGSKPAISIPANSSAITVDWSAMMTNAVGEAFIDGTISDIRVLHFPFSAEQLDSKILDLDISFDKEYKGAWSGAVAESEKLSILTDAQGQPFPGIDPSMGGTWVLALMCRSDICGSPAPWYMARLEACP